MCGVREMGRREIEDKETNNHMIAITSMNRSVAYWIDDRGNSNKETE
jgi:hypothetical protein